MHQNPSFAEVQARINGGRFKEARELLGGRRHELQRLDSALLTSITAELDVASGDLESARRAAERQLRDTQSTPIHVVAHRILGEVFANELQFEHSLSHYRSARALIREGVPEGLAASTQLSFWGWFSGVLPLESAQAELADVRKAVARSAQPNHIAELRLCVLRVEARRGTTQEAQRHWRLAEKLLEAHPNPKLQAQLELDGCMLALFGGDLRSALDHATRALEHGQDCRLFSRFDCGPYRPSPRTSCDWGFAGGSATRF